MQANKPPSALPDAAGSKPQPIASALHLAGFLAIGIAVAGLGFLAQHAQSGAPAGQLASHGVALQVYLSAIVLDWALFYYCWIGVHRGGGSLWSLSGGRWTGWKSVGVDIAVVIPFWGIWEGAAYGVARLLGPSTAKTVDNLLPHSLVEVLLWIATCATAGICEEMVFRGYLQRQFHAFGGVVFAVLGQGVVFGILHGYQGWRNVVVISVLGILYGLLAQWRGNLRANIISHAWSDFWEGWLKFLIFR